MDAPAQEYSFLKTTLSLLWVSCTGSTSFIHSGYFYSASSSPLLLGSTPDTARIVCQSFTVKRDRQLRVKDFAQGLYVTARAGFEPVTLRTKGVDSTNEPICPTPWCTPLIDVHRGAI